MWKITPGSWLFDSWEFGWHYASSDCGQMFLASVTEKRNDTPQAHSNEAFFIPTLLIPNSADSWESPAVLLEFKNSDSTNLFQNKNYQLSVVFS